jgi:hypothetical protein
MNIIKILLLIDLVLLYAVLYRMRWLAIWKPCFDSLKTYMRDRQR